jgi:adenylate cyclase
MNDRQILELTEWVTEAGLAGASETALVDGFCRRLVEYGVPLTRVAALIDTLPANPDQE